MSMPGHLPLSQDPAATPLAPVLLLPPRSPQLTARCNTGVQELCIYSVVTVLMLRVLLKRGRSRKSKRGVEGAPSSSSTVMLLGRPTRSTEPGTKRVCWGPRWGQYRPMLKPFIHSWPWKMDGTELYSCPPSLPLPAMHRLTLPQPGNFTKVSQVMPGVSKVPA